MIHWIWFLMSAGSVFYACIMKKGGQVLEAAMQGTRRSITLTLELLAGYLLFCGLMEIAKSLQIPGRLNRLMRPIFRLLMPGAGKASEAVTMNVSMNILGLGNAATPAGIEAMRQLEEERKSNPLVRQDMYMFLIINATSLQLIPTTILTLRMAAGSADPGAVLIPTLVCTAVSTFAGTLAGMCCRQWETSHAA